MIGDDEDCEERVRPGYGLKGKEQMEESQGQKLRS